MQPASLLLAPGRSIYPLNLSALSDQALMEAFIDELTAESRADFTNPDGSYKDKCKWRGVRCNGRRQVIEIDMENEGKAAKSLTGKLSFASLPPTLSNLHVTNHNLEGIKLMGSFDTKTLPPKLMKCLLRGVTITRKVDLRWLPSDVWFFGVLDGVMWGTCCLTSLPKNMKALILTSNVLSSSIVLDRLPEQLETLDVSKNGLSGTINLRNLPKKIETLGLSDNRFSGEIDISNLPNYVVKIDLSGNSLSGTLRCVSLPERMESLDVRKNSFILAVVPRGKLYYVSADFSKMRCITESGELMTAKEISIHKERRAQRQKVFDEFRKNYTH